MGAACREAGHQSGGEIDVSKVRRESQCDSMRANLIIDAGNTKSIEGGNLPMSRIIQPKAEPNHAQASVALAAHEAEPKPSSAVKNVKDMSADKKPARVANLADPRNKPAACDCCGRGYAGEASAGLSWSNRVGKWACVRCHFASASTSKTSSSSTK